MSEVDDELAQARRTSDDARKALAQTLIALQMRLKPSALARDAVVELKQVAGELAQQGVEAAKRKPLAIAGTLAAVGAFFARKPLVRLLRRKPETD
jgi:hypothetical protein